MSRAHCTYIIIYASSYYLHRIYKARIFESDQWPAAEPNTTTEYKRGPTTIHIYASIRVRDACNVFKLSLIISTSINGTRSPLVNDFSRALL